MLTHRSKLEHYYTSIGKYEPVNRITDSDTIVQMTVDADGTDEYMIDSPGAHALLGQCVEYEIDNIFDPVYTVVCKLRESLLQFNSDL